MKTTAKHHERPWAALDVCPDALRVRQPGSDLEGIIERVEHGLDHGSTGKLIHSLLAVRAALRSRLAAEPRDGFTETPHGPIGPWKRRLRRRYAASLCSVDRILDDAWSPEKREGLEPAVRAELSRLRRLAALENRADLDQHWTDLGVGD